MKPDSLVTFSIKTQTSNFIKIRPVGDQLLQASGRAGKRAYDAPKIAKRDYKGARHKDIYMKIHHAQAYPFIPGRTKPQHLLGRRLGGHRLCDGY